MSKEEVEIPALHDAGGGHGVLVGSLVDRETKTDLEKGSTAKLKEGSHDAKDPEAYDKSPRDVKTPGGANEETIQHLRKRLSLGMRTTTQKQMVRPSAVHDKTQARLISYSTNYPSFFLVLLAAGWIIIVMNASYTVYVSNRIIDMTTGCDCHTDGVKETWSDIGTDCPQNGYWKLQDPWYYKYTCDNCPNLDTGSIKKQNDWLKGNENHVIVQYIPVVLYLGTIYVGILFISLLGGSEHKVVNYMEANHSIKANPRIQLGVDTVRRLEIRCQCVECCCSEKESCCCPKGKLCCRCPPQKKSIELTGWTVISFSLITIFVLLAIPYFVPGLNAQSSCVLSNRLKIWIFPIVTGVAILAAIITFIVCFIKQTKGGIDDHFQTQVFPHWDEIGYGVNEFYPYGTNKFSGQSACAVLCFSIFTGALGAISIAFYLIFYIPLKLAKCCCYPCCKFVKQCEECGDYWEEGVDNYAVSGGLVAWVCKSFCPALCTSMCMCCKCTCDARSIKASGKTYRGVFTELLLGHEGEHDDITLIKKTRRK